MYIDTVYSILLYHSTLYYRCPFAGRRAGPALSKASSSTDVASMASAGLLDFLAAARSMTAAALRASS